MHPKLFGIKTYLLFITLAALYSCSSPTPIRIGFVAELTGVNSALGVDGRDGVLLAIERINAEGGIHGHPLKLVIGDDLGTPEGAVQADGKLIREEKVFVIIGHMTSGTMISAWDAYKDSGVLYLSPTVSTPQLAGLDDNFLRLIPINSYVAEKLAQHAIHKLGLKQVAIIYDADNAAFTNTYQESFSRAFESQGGKVVHVYEFSSKQAPDFSPVLKDIKALQADGLFLATSAFDTALIAQQAKLGGLKAQLLATNWALTNGLMENGGKAVDGIITAVTHSENNQMPAYLSFSEQFVERFHRQPTFAAGYGYEAAMILANALKKTNGERAGLKEALLETKNFNSIHGEISFDPYGDVLRTLYLVSVLDGEFQTTPLP